MTTEDPGPVPAAGAGKRAPAAKKAATPRKAAAKKTTAKKTATPRKAAAKKTATATETAPAAPVPGEGDAVAGVLDFESLDADGFDPSWRDPLRAIAEVIGLALMMIDFRRREVEVENFKQTQLLY